MKYYIEDNNKKAKAYIDSENGRLFVSVYDKETDKQYDFGIDEKELQLIAYMIELEKGGREMNEKTCRTCEHRQQWECGGRIIQYCGVSKSNRTFNGLQKTKVTNPSCDMYKEEGK